jgi:hypothetical protein
MRSPEDFPADDCFKRAKEQDAKCRAVFGPTWSMEQAADLFRLLDAERLSATERAATIADTIEQPGIPGTGEWLALGNFAGQIAAAIRSQP